MTAFAVNHALSEDTKPASDIRFPSGSTNDLAITDLKTARLALTCILITELATRPCGHVTKTLVINLFTMSKSRKRKHKTEALYFAKCFPMQ